MRPLNSTTKINLKYNTLDWIYCILDIAKKGGVTKLEYKLIEITKSES